jgi:ATP-dependent DNA helicase RecQ
MSDGHTIITNPSAQLAPSHAASADVQSCRRDDGLAEIDAVRHALQTVFGFADFRPGQLPVINLLLTGRSALAVFPTGSGKSLCFQLPALLLGCLTLVVSPLLALMREQVDYLRRRGIRAARLDSTLTHGEAASVLRQIRNRELQILYVSPERVGTETFRSLVLPGAVSLFVVDEAHCMSEWGHNFRPEYLKLARFAGEIRAERVLALTATATPQVAADIAAAFGIAPDGVVRTGFYRPNLHLAITPVAPDGKIQTLVERLRTRPRGPTIVYVTHQETAELVAARLCEAGFSAHSYHAGMMDEDRQAIQDEFMSSATNIIVATIAFGMGVDKSNIRYVYHYNLPKSPEGYSQEIGRAGRDGEPSHCELLLCPEDVLSLENFAYGDTPAWTAVAGLVIDLFSRTDPELELNLTQLSQHYDIRITVLKTLLTYLELGGCLLERGPRYETYRFRRIDGRFGGLAVHADLMEQLFCCARRGTTWYTLSADAAASQLHRTREELVNALAEAQELGTIELEPCDVRLRYRRIQQPGQLDQLLDWLMGRLLQRESREIARLHQVLQFAAHDGCQTNWLAAYFGEVREAPCGHCQWCRTGQPLAMPLSGATTPDRSIIRAALEARELHAELREEPSVLVKFLCGIRSPWTSRAKLMSHALFGACRTAPFQSVANIVRQEGGSLFPEGF